MNDTVFTTSWTNESGFSKLSSVRFKKSFIKKVELERKKDAFLVKPVRVTKIKQPVVLDTPLQLNLFF